MRSLIASLWQAGAAQIRGCHFDPDLGLGVFARLPLTDEQRASTNAEIGLRCSSPDLSAGVVCQPLSEQLSHLWLVGRLCNGQCLLKVETWGFLVRQLSGRASWFCQSMCAAAQLEASCDFAKYEAWSGGKPSLQHDLSFHW